MANIEHTDFTHRVTDAWVAESIEDRLNRIRFFLNAYKDYKMMEVQDAFDNGHVVLRIEQSIPANERGLFLLELEERIKTEIDVGITIWLEPVGDKSKLRQLRGVEVKT